MSNVVGEVEGVLNIVTNLGIDSLNFNVVFSDEIVEEESAEEETEGNPLLDMLLDALGMGEEEETEEEAVEVVEEEELRKITAVVLDGAVGLTQSNLDFGVLYYGEEQETEIIEIENLGEGLLTITGFEGGDAEGLIFVYDLEQSFNLYAGERFSFELTCVPSREGEFGAEGLTVKTLLGNFNIGIRCVGALEVDETLDEIPPVINIVSPSGGSVSGVVPVVVNTYDEGGISNNPATVSYYLDNILMGLITQHPFEFEFDSSRFENGIYEIFVKVQDYAGNIAYDSVSIWINNGGPAVQETSLVSGVEPGTIIYSEDVLNSGFSFEVDSGEGYQILESGDVIGDEFNLKVKYALASLNEDVSIELKGAKLTEGLDILMENNDVQKISKEFSGGEVVIIDIDGEVLKNLIKETGAETVVMPLLLKSDSFGDKETYSDVEVWYYPLDEDPFDITNRIIFLEYVSELMENGVEYTLFNIEFDAVVVTGG